MGGWEGGEEGGWTRGVRLGNTLHHILTLGHHCREGGRKRGRVRDRVKQNG